MAEYFATLPKTLYDLRGDKPSNPLIVANITARAKVVNVINSLVFYKYQVKENETPEMIADKYYGSPGRHWIVLLANNIVDPQYDWPLGYQSFVSFVASKYGSLAAAQATIHHYEKTVTKLYSVTNYETTTVYEIDKTAYDAMAGSTTSVINLTGGGSVTITTSKAPVYAYDYEERVNENKRNINLIDKVYVNQLESELGSIFKNVGI